MRTGFPRRACPDAAVGYNLVGKRSRLGREVHTFERSVQMGMYSAMMKQVHEHAKKLEESGQLERMFQVQEPKHQPTGYLPPQKREQVRGRNGK